jgi:hypothetical protein
MSRIYRGQTVQLRFETGMSLVGATATKILYKKPGATTESFWTATVDGTELVYTTSTADLDTVGDWQFQPYAEFGAAKRPGDTIIIQTVEEPLY